MKSFVCMIAYTDGYNFDSRVRGEAELLASHGFQVRCLTNMSGRAPVRFVLSGVEVRELPVAKYRGKNTAAYLGYYLWFLLLCSAACLRLLLKGELDVVHVHNVPDFLVLAGLVPRLAGRKVVLDVHDSVPETFATKFSGPSFLQHALRLEESWSARLAHKVICVNHPQRDVLVGRGIPSTKTFIFMNVPDPAIFGRQPTNVGTDPKQGTFNLVYHGTMTERLGVDLIIRAVAGLRNRIPNVRLHLWGGGDDLERFRNLARDLAEEAVVFKPKGFLLHDLPRQLASMHVGVVGNRRNIATDLMLPVKLLEYVAMGIPTVAPRLRTIERYFAADMVTYYEPENVEALEEAIYRLYSCPTARRAQAERADDFLRQHGWARQGNELVTFYRQLVES